MNKPTLGPWSIDGFNLSGVIALVPGREKIELICECKTDRNPIEFKEAKANARLIASSPTMYEYINKKANNGDAEAKRIIEVING